MSQKTNCRHILVFMMVVIFFISGSFLVNNNISHHSRPVERTCNQSEDTINQLKNIMCELNFENIQSRNYLRSINEKPEQYRVGNNFNKRILLFYCLLEGLALLVIAWCTYILIMRSKLINYLIAIIYIHKSDGQKDKAHILLNS